VPDAELSDVVAPGFDAFSSLPPPSDAMMMMMMQPEPQPGDEPDDEDRGPLLPADPDAADDYPPVSHWPPSTKPTDL